MGARQTPTVETRRAVFLDRDGVLVVPDVVDGKTFAPRTIEAFKFYPAARKSLARLRRDFHLVVVTNQPDVGRQLIPSKVYMEMTRRLMTDLAVHTVYSCLHDDQDNCDCRKPKPGMILRAAQGRRINLAESFMVGDTWRDIEAGKAAGVGATVLIDRGFGEGVDSVPTVTVTSLSQAVDFILGMAP